ncbi:hypothetical protein SAMN00777080_3072 [Aquiflexum balticum DSM 16537]|uniref:Uncharacterized protein n=1 Tax=Aquiflexum balticum DSM 16537 TaxID=758820 RepID=A0A1W2H6E2_9BACT|nr:hypothetical protein [Aquiflexum balticum]SMD44451.1 hypothetical protein SAMN00777080_3072 [Aquiflexum balticum DSM 16537]
MFKKRCVIYPKDVQIITGKSERYGQDLLNKIRIYLNKKPHQFITIKEFSDFSGIPTQDLEEYI